MSGQAEFRAALLDADLPVPAGLTDGAGRPAGRRFSVYRNNVTVALTEALETAFPVLQKLLGTENFRSIAGVYLRQHPPRSPLMMHYGADMADFLAGFAPLAHLPYLPDVARLEQALRRSYHAADAPVADVAPLATLTPDALLQLRLTLAPSCELVSSAYPLHGIWAFNMADGPKPAARPEPVLILRTEFDPVPHRLDPAGAACIAALMQGTTLGRAHEAAIARDADFDLAAILGLLIASGAISDLRVKGED